MTKKEKTFCWFAQDPLLLSLKHLKLTSVNSYFIVSRKKTIENLLSTKIFEISKRNWRKLKFQLTRLKSSEEPLVQNWKSKKEKRKLKLLKWAAEIKKGPHKKAMWPPREPISVWCVLIERIARSLVMKTISKPLIVRRPTFIAVIAPFTHFVSPFSIIVGCLWYECANHEQSIH